MDAIFIDSNILLSFYSNESTYYRSLLPILKSLKSRVFIPKQVVHEVERNKARIYKSYFDSYFQLTQLPDLPVFNYLFPTDKPMQKWESKRSSVRKQLQDLKAQLEQIRAKRLDSVYKGKDDVTKVLQLLFQEAKDATENELVAARLRRERGNPPGKKNDTLGDQICWEQILSITKNVKRLWIVSRDNDYLADHEEGVLNTLLELELKAVNSKVKFFCFRYLSEALINFYSHTKIKNPPSLDDLRKSLEAEKEIFNFEKIRI